MTEPLTYTMNEAARLIGISPRTLWGHLQPRGTLPVVRIGKRVLIRKQDLEQWLTQLSQAGGRNDTEERDER